jgi:hypothetical protein
VSLVASFRFDRRRLDAAVERYLRAVGQLRAAGNVVQGRVRVVGQAATRFETRFRSRGG